MKNLTILIVEDIEINRSILANIFQSEYIVLEAENGKVALEILQQGVEVDLILLDLMMPVMNGLQFLNIIKQENQYAKIPVVVNSVNGEQENEIKALELGADDFIAKPYNPRILKQRVKNLIDKYILEKRDMETRLLDTSVRLSTLINTVPGGIGLFELGERITAVYVNEVFHKLLGYNKDELNKELQDPYTTLLFGKNMADVAENAKNITGTYQKTIQVRKKNGEYIWLGMNAKKMDVDGHKDTIQVVFMDLTREKQTEQKMQESMRLLRYQVECDVLTGIYNRDTFYEKTKEMLLLNTEKRYVLTVWDIEKFKVVNDLFGGRTADRILKNIANVLKSTIAEDGTYGRLESDHFVLCTTMEKLRDNRDFLSHILEKGVQGNTIKYPVMIHMGVFMIEDIHMPVSIMCDRAGLALHSIKNNVVERWALYEESMRDLMLNEQELVNEMKEALQNKQFYIQLQPIVQATTGKIVSAEALVRWNHPIKGKISPGEFIPIFERNGSITRLDNFVWDEVCKFLADNKEHGCRNVPISVNVSRVNFYDENLCEQLLAILDKYQLEPDLLKLEITESAYTNNSEQLLCAMKRFQDQGFRVLMDDFGSGYSSLNMLKDVPVDILKIDMKFIHTLETSERAYNILYNIFNMAKSLGMHTIAEGVETKSQYELLRSMGCNDIQGYFFSKPLLLDEFREKVQEDNIAEFLHLEQKKPLILVADDVEIIRASIDAVLSDEYELMEVENGQEALEIVQKEYARLKLVITDIHMPVMDGFELISQMSKSPSYSRIPVLVLTGEGEADYAIKAISLGAVDVIVKPFEPDIFLRRVKNMIRLDEEDNSAIEIHSLRENNLAKQNHRKLVNGQLAGICKLRANLNKDSFHMEYTNAKYQTIHGLSEDCNNQENHYRIFTDQVVRDDQERLISILKKTVENKETFVQFFYSLIKTDGKVTKILANCGLTYRKDYIIIEVVENEIVSSGGLTNYQIVEDIMEDMLSDSNLFAWRYDVKSDTVTEVNNRYAMGNSEKQFMDNAAERISKNPVFRKEDRERVYRMFQRVKNGEKKVVEDFYCHSDHNWWSRIILRTLFDENGRPMCALGITEDVSELLYANKVEDPIRYREILVRDAFLLAEVDLNENKFVSFDCNELQGLQSKDYHFYENFIQAIIDRYIHGEDAEYIYQMMDRTKLLEWFRSGEKELKFDMRMQIADAYEWYHANVYLLQRAENKHVYMIWQLKNVNSDRVHIEKIRNLAEHDLLTGLYNRIPFEKKIDELYADQNNYFNLAAFIMVDVDNFKKINDSFGHEFGDTTLQTIAK